MGVVIEKSRQGEGYETRLRALAQQRLIKGVTTDELMLLLRGDPAEDPPLDEK